MLAVVLSVVFCDDQKERFQRLYRALEDSVRGLVFKLLGDERQTEDAVQQCWANVIGSFDRISAMPWQEAQGYVAVCARNAAYDQIRKIQRQGAEVPMPEGWEPESMTQDGNEFYRLVSIIREMPENYRQVLELKFVCEWTNKQIAQALDLSETAVSTRVSRGRALLIERLKEEGYTYE